MSRRDLTNRQMKWCPNCETELDRANFTSNIKSVDGLSAYCIQCYRERQRNYYAENRDSLLEKRRIRDLKRRQK